jgi:hypothetical protein
MYYVEFLRARRALIVAAAWIAVALAINVVSFKTGNVDVPSHGFSIPLTVVWGFAAMVASIYASILGGSLAAENDGHLPVAWTKPVSRVNHALTKMAIDLCAVALVFGMMCVAVWAYFEITGLARLVTVPSDAWFQLVRFLIAPAAFYGLMQAMTSSLGRQAGMVLGFTWAGLLALLILGVAPLPQPYQAVIGFINDANPLVYIAFDIEKSGNVVSVGLSAALTALVLIAICGSAAAIYRWQRVEA